MSPQRRDKRELLRLGVLASGSGSNLQAILDACSDERIPARVAAVICNVEGAAALARAQKAGVPAVLLPHREYPTREIYDAQLVAELQRNAVQLVCLAGFMRIVSPVLLRAFPDRVLNIHPSLLPAFPGLHAVRQAVRAGVKVAGCTVHIVDEGTDTGPVLVQAVVPVLEGDDEAALAARILVQEHKAYPRAIGLVAAGAVEVVSAGVGRQVRLRVPQGDAARALSSPPLEGDR
ncbi:MAG: phosphoribosylglycinamide formyltransferase [Myxococcales bacterium]